MSRISVQRTAARAAVLMALLVAVMGPWTNSTLLLIVGGRRRTRWMFHRTALGLAATLSLLLVAAGRSELGQRLWGVWLYFGGSCCIGR